jgi:hypothetical protein
MRNAWIRRVLGTTTCGLLALGMVGPAQGSPYLQPDVVLTNPVNFTPNLVEIPGQRKPVAYSIAEAGTQMVVGGDFQQISNSTGTTFWNRSNVFALNATNGTVSESFAPQVDGAVWSVLSDGTSVYIGGGFRNVNGTPRAALAKLDLATGQLDPNFNPTFKTGRITDMQMLNGMLVVSGTIKARLKTLNATTGKPLPYISNVVDGRLPNSNPSQVFKFDISPNGQHLVAVGNFLTVDGQSRPRVFMLDLGATAATLSSWHYDPLGLSCTSTRVNAIAYVQDVDFAPDSSYFALAAFGFMYQSGQRGSQICDSVSRFDTDNLSPSTPHWINYTGGDSLKSVAVTGAAVYVQGHSRWLDNPFGQDFAGPGAVSRPGGGAVDPDTGMALDWNPVMPQQSGGFKILPTATGVWFATDGERFGHELRRGIRFAPLP